MRTVVSLVLLAFALSTSAVSLQVGTVRGFPGNTVEVPVSLRYGSNEVRDVVALQADLMFDASGLNDGPLTGGSQLSHHTLASSAPSAGTRRLLVYSLENATLTNGVVITIPFTVGPQEYRNFPLTLSNVTLVRADASQVVATNANGFIAVSQVFVAPDRHVDGFLYVASNQVDQCYVIQATTDFQSWVSIQTNSATGSLLEFADPGAVEFPHRFYRAILCEMVAGLGTNRVSMQVGTITQLAGRRVQFELFGLNGRSYVIQASTDLTEWENIWTNVGTGGPIVFIDGVTNQAHRFYRMRTE